MDFVNELWKSVLTPGTSPALILATHLTFASLVITLSFFALYSKSIHLINLLVISILLWITLTWFINEINSLEKSDLKDNNELAEEKTDTETKNQAVESKSSSSEPKKVIQPVQRKSKKI
ncbi:hypothetical protein WICANDRAFT_89371 [Wickerhamomyces anomalus NRRL Y-366-8]|uniref:Uncharacterized protein n=1 Tax=Wickerhamomyces anomalus (strain ATCC 58044 / CBS 1984 / NCYC 433 / NRRL Y-366-8) TaxID=683960 RepID=A0A1E3PC76_WICAA|nr:uncharacterized protein WICANDRAFT_89371 [Wickerhamomyces anomalus NRRL Y-366-8]ODQ63016.1 hypothetical protein WICANDRAFT_89371 [Wickerhamomyces anomalus NRRL Y-366-8]